LHCIRDGTQNTDDCKSSSRVIGGKIGYKKFQEHLLESLWCDYVYTDRGVTFINNNNLFSSSSVFIIQC
jgi:hypothetical protein